MTEEIQNIQTLIQGLETKIAEKETDKSQFERAAGIEEMAEKAKKEISEIELDIEDLKEKLLAKKSKKSNAVQVSLKALIKTMNKTLPQGSALISIEDSQVTIGWTKDKVFRPYHGLSGSEKVIYDRALAAAFKANILLFEAAEIDSENLTIMLEKLLESDNQIIMSSWFKPERIPEGWTIIEL